MAKQKAYIPASTSKTLLQRPAVSAEGRQAFDLKLGPAASKAGHGGRSMSTYTF